MDASVNRIPSSRDERAFLLSIQLPEITKENAEYSINELELLVKTAGGFVSGKRIIKRRAYDSSYIAGAGFWEQMSDTIQKESIKLVVLDINNLRPGQVRNIEEKIKVRVIGRTEIILDIFACRAKSRESKLQIELAKLNYILPRLKGYGKVLSRLGGGIGTRGPGEKMLEKDRRHIQRRITVLKNDLSKIKKHRDRTRKSRNSCITCAVAGYTNAGKSTLVNSLARDDLFVENRLFATLEAYTRTVYLEEGKKLLMTDTVGFIRNLPANLVASFRSTLEEITDADFVLHVVDATAEDFKGHIQTVHDELLRLEVDPENVLLYCNKSDRIGEEQKKLVKTLFPEAVFGSAIAQNGTDKLRRELISMYEKIASVKYPHYLRS
jgi:GTP-binding protein HflX